jgi:pyruvate ferredoxin oxidoreductase beta subunit
VPVEEWLRPQKRFAHLFSSRGAAVRKEIQRQVDADWEALVVRCAQ